MWIRRITAFPRCDSEGICSVLNAAGLVRLTLLRKAKKEKKKPRSSWSNTRKSALNPRLEEWPKMMEAVKHKASVPAEVMLLAASEETKNSVLLSEEPGKDVP